MWIVPKTLSNFVPDTGESQWELKELSQRLESELFVRSKPMRWQTWLKKLKREKWIARLSGLILKPSQEKAFTEKYTASLEAIPASRLARQEKGEENKTPDTFFLIYSELLNQLNLFGAFLKTSKDTSHWDMDKFTEAFDIWVTQSRQDYLVRVSVEHRIKESDYLYWPTIRVAAQHEGYRTILARGRTLTLFAMMQYIQEKGKWSLENWVSGQHDLEQKNINGKKKEQLNPEWVEQYMGIPIGWTELEC